MRDHMKRLFFGPRPSICIFHHEVTKCKRGLKGVITIHNNILVFGSNATDHNINLENCVKRAEETGVRLKLSKSTFLIPEVRWFGRIFSHTGISADSGKTSTNVEARHAELPASLLIQCKVCT